MCGIIGYIGNKEAVPLLIDGLKKLEYRGYDSAGFCVGSGKNLYVLKRKGMVKDLEVGIEQGKSLGNMGIAHTRWATHGEPNEINSHPHLDCTGQIAIVHNGIIENHSSLKKLLKEEGHKFVSDTDSEVIAHLIEKFNNGNIEEAVAKALSLIEGTYGLLAVNKNEQKIVAAKKGSPLVIGIGSNEMFLASDVPAILANTQKVVYLNDGEMAVVKKDKYLVKKMNGKLVDKQVHRIAMNVEQMEKKGFKHFMLKEDMNGS